MTLTFLLISRTPTDPCISHTSYPPTSPVPLHAPISNNFLLVSTSLVLYLGQLVRRSSGGLVIVFYFDTPYLSSGLSLEQIVGLSLVHSSLCFLGCESWVRLNYYLFIV